MFKVVDKDGTLREVNIACYVLRATSLCLVIAAIGAYLSSLVVTPA